MLSPLSAIGNLRQGSARDLSDILRSSPDLQRCLSSGQNLKAVYLCLDSDGKGYGSEFIHLATLHDVTRSLTLESNERNTDRSPRDSRVTVRSLKFEPRGEVDGEQVWTMGGA